LDRRLSAKAEMRTQKTSFVSYLASDNEFVETKRHSTLLENIEMFGPEKGRLDNGDE